MIKQTIEPDYTRQEAARVLNIGTYKLDELIRNGDLASYRLGPGKRAARRIPRAALEAIRGGQTPQTPAQFRGGKVTATSTVRG